MGNDATDAIGAAVRTPALVLGIAGLLPFVGLCAVLFFWPHPFHGMVYRALNAYGAVILAFVGALHWGMSLREFRGSRAEGWIALLSGVVPAVLAWAAILLPSQTGLRLLAASFVACLAMDVRFASRHEVPPWYFRLRAGLTAVVVACLLGASLAPLPYPVQQIRT
jgi:hypothetical protein